MCSYRQKINTVFIVPTGVGAEIGGHAGDANPAAKLIASVSDILITHPNVVNASDINEMTENTLYVEGSILDRFLEGEIELQPIFYNRILVAVNAPVSPHTINAVSAARTTIGADVSIVELTTPLIMRATKADDNTASGIVYGWQELVDQVSQYDFDALAITSLIEVDEKTELDYVRHGGVNPWGGVEAKASRLIASALNKPVAHCPFGYGSLGVNFCEVVEPRISAEMISMCYLHCALKGLHRAPRIGSGLSVRDVSCLITPFGCVGRPHKACLERDIPIIAVRENSTCLNDPMPDSFIIVENYLEAVGYIAAMRAGVHPSSVRRPIRYTDILR